jgi:hypothetical protein
MAERATVVREERDYAVVKKRASLDMTGTDHETCGREEPGAEEG